LQPSNFERQVLFLLSTPRLLETHIMKTYKSSLVQALPTLNMQVPLPVPGRRDQGHLGFGVWDLELPRIPVTVRPRLLRPPMY